MIVSHISILSLAFAGQSYNQRLPYLDTSIAGCTNETFSDFITRPKNSFWTINDDTHKQFSLVSEIPFPKNILLVSYMYYVVFGTIITVVLGIFISLITRSSDDVYDSKLIHPGVYKLTTYLPCCDKLFTKTKTFTDDLPCGSCVASTNMAFDMNEKKV